MSDIKLALTNKGKALKAKIEQGNGDLPLELTRIVTASGTSTDPLSLTDVIGLEQTFTITNKQTVGTKTTITAVVTNFGDGESEENALKKGYYLSQIGFYAVDPEEGEILYRISQYENASYVPAASERPWTFNPQFHFETGNASEVNLSIEPTGLASILDILNLKTQMMDSFDILEQKIQTGVDTEENLQFQIDGMKDDLMSAEDKGKLNGIAANAEVNQNAVSYIKVGSTVISANQKTDTIELVAGTNISVTGDSTAKKVTVSAPVAIKSPGVLSVQANGRAVASYDGSSSLTANIILSKGDVGLGSVDNTSDVNKPVSTAVQSALNGKAASSHTHTKAQVGLGNVDNTSDTAKPVSTAVQSALNGKAASSHTHAASQITAGTLVAGVKATYSTDYGTSRVRNAYFSTAKPSALSNGDICFVYE